MSAIPNDVLKRRSAFLLGDAKGIYGLRVEAGPNHCEINVRPDKVSPDSAPDILHALPRNTPRWCNGLEKSAVSLLHMAMTEDAGIPSVPFKDLPQRDAQSWFGYRRLAEKTINSLLSRLYAEVVPAGWLSTIRRYPIRRGNLYAGLCRGGDRAWQLAETFPVLALFLYSRDTDSDCNREARRRVRAGAPLRSVAGMAGVPMAFRRFPPAVANLKLRAGEVLARHPDVIENHAPATVPRLRVWLRAISAAKESGGEDFAVWVARHGEGLGHWRGIPEIARDMGDWANASARADLVSRINDDQAGLISELMGDTDPVSGMLAARLHSERQRATVLGRPFRPEMAPQTALALSDEWHERVSQLDGAASVEFPKPWYEGGEIDGYTVTPITTPIELSAAARRFRNCSAGYAEDVASGDRFLYAVSTETPVAMFELLRGDKPRLGQIKGPCNKTVPSAVTKAVKRWFQASKRSEGKGAMPEDSVLGVIHPGEDVDFELDIPF